MEKVEKIEVSFFSFFCFSTWVLCSASPSPPVDLHLHLPLLELSLRQCLIHPTSATSPLTSSSSVALTSIPNHAFSPSSTARSDSSTSSRDLWSSTFLDDSPLSCSIVATSVAISYLQHPTPSSTSSELGAATSQTPHSIGPQLHLTPDLASPQAHDPFLVIPCPDPASPLSLQPTELHLSRIRRRHHSLPPPQSSKSLPSLRLGYPIASRCLRLYSPARSAAS